MIKINNVIANQNLNREIDDKLRELEANVDYETDSDLQKSGSLLKELQDTLDNSDELGEDTIVITFKSFNADECVAIKASRFEEFEEKLRGAETLIEYSTTFLKARNMIPGLGITYPRGMGGLETVEEYEKYLKDYYAACGFVAKVDENGVRAPYPHETYELIKGKYANYNSKNYLSEYYRKNVLEVAKDKIEKQQQEMQENNTVVNESTADDTKAEQNEVVNDASEVTQDSVRDNEQTDVQQDNVVSKKKYKKRKVSKKQSFADFFFGMPDKVKNVDKALGKDELWANAKKGLMRAGVVALIGGVVIGVGSKLASIGGVVSQALAVPNSGAIISSLLMTQAGPLLAAGLGTAAVVAGTLFYLKGRKKWKEGKQNPPTEQTPINPEMEQSTDEPSLDNTVEQTVEQSLDNTPQQEVQEVSAGVGETQAPAPENVSTEAEPTVVEEAPVFANEADEEYLIDQLRNVKNETDGYKMSDRTNTAEYKNLLQQKKRIILMLMKLYEQQKSVSEKTVEGGMSL